MKDVDAVLAGIVNAAERAEELARHLPKNSDSMDYCRLSMLSSLDHLIETVTTYRRSLVAYIASQKEEESTNG